PVVEGYPGAVHLGRTQDQGDFSDEELDHLAECVRQFDERARTTRVGRRSGVCTLRARTIERPNAYITVFDAAHKQLFPRADGENVDERLRVAMIDQIKRTQVLNGDD